MTTVRFNFRRGDFTTPVEGSVGFAPYRRIHVDGTPDVVVIPDPVYHTLTNGQVEVELEPNDASWAWVIRERFPLGITRIVAVPDTAVVDYGDLVDLDPLTLTPTANPEAAWWAALENVASPIPYVVTVTVVTGNEARPNAIMVMWIGGTTKPVNMAEGDLWYSGSTTTPEQPAATPPTINTVTLAAMTQGQAINQNLSVTGTTPIMWSATAGALPAGVNVSSTGIVSGTPTGSGAYTVTLTATNEGGSDSQTYTGSVTAAPVEPEPEPDTNVTVFGDSTRGVTFSAYNDGGALRIVNGFYTYGAGMNGKKALGMRIYIPAGMSITPGTAYLYAPPVGTPPAASLAGVTPVTMPLSGLVAGQWNTVLFPDPVSLTLGVPVYVGYEFGNGAYIASSAGAPASDTPLTSTPAGVALMENQAMVGGQPWDRSLYRPNNGDWGTSPTAPSYGIDIVIEGA